MDVLHTTTRYLRGLTYSTRLIVTTACLFLFFFLFASGYTFLRDGSILALPIALAAWFFRRYEPWLYLGITILAVALTNSYVYQGLFWPRPLVLAFFEGSSIFCIEVIVIRLLRNLLDMHEATEKKALLAEQQLMLAYEQQQQLLLLKDQFIMSVNHELRTPLTEVQGYLELLRIYHAQLDEEMRARFIDNAAHGCDDLKYLVDTVVDVHIISDTPPTPEYELVNVHSVVALVLEQFDPRKLDFYPVNVDIHEQMTVWCDKNQIKQILRNLISNAFKYALVHTPIQITATPTIAPKEHEGGFTMQTCISVRDAGPGIPPAELPLLFEKFVRLQRDLAGSERGSGLGLYLSKKLVENMGGKIWVESSGVAGEGSCFSFSLPSSDPNKARLHFVTKP